MMDRANYDALEVVTYIWKQLGLPESHLSAINLPGEGNGVPSSFKVGRLAQASIALSALSAALVHAQREGHTPTGSITVALDRAVAEFSSEELMTLDGQKQRLRAPFGGLHKTLDGYVRIHDGFPHHREGTKKLLGLHEDAGHTDVAKAVAQWKALELETAGVEAGLVVVALRSFEQWDGLPQSTATADFPILLRQIAGGPPALPPHLRNAGDKCLRGLRVIDMTRVIAGPVGGKTLAAHGADVLWITSPSLPNQPDTDRDVNRGKRTLSLDIEKPEDRKTLDGLLADADVFLQSYRPGSLAAKGLSPEAVVAKSKNGIICANLSAYGVTGPWSERRGFDSIVQTCSGFNVSEAEHYGDGEDSRVLPCQVHDHASGYFLATGISAALYKQATEGGSYEVNVSLAGTMKFLRSLGQFEGKSGFVGKAIKTQADVPSHYLEDRYCEFGKLKAMKHSAEIEGVNVGWEIMPKTLGSDDPSWLA